MNNINNLFSNTFKSMYVYINNSINKKIDYPFIVL